MAKLYLSKLVLNPEHSGVVYDVGNAHAMHQRIMLAFPPCGSDIQSPRSYWSILYCLNNSLDLLVQSTHPPDWSTLPRSYADQIDAKSISLDPIHQGQHLNFRILANPSCKTAGVRRGITKLDRQDRWFRYQANRNGFDVLNLIISPRPNVRGWKKTDSEKTHKITHTAAFFSGTLQVLNIDKFRHTLQSGLGHGRSYGLGLLAIAPISQ